MSLDAKLAKLSPDEAKEALAAFLRRFSTPAFGALPKREIELAVFEMMCDLGIIDEDASLYTLMTSLKVTRSKASQLLFDRDIRLMGDDVERLDQEVKTALLGTRFAKDGDYFVMEIDNPLVLAHLKNKLRGFGHLSDSSFNASLVRMTTDAATDLALSLMDAKRHELVRRALVRAGAPDASVKGVVKSAFKTLGAKVLGEAAGSVVENASDFLSPLFKGAESAIATAWSSLFKGNGKPDAK